MRENIILASGSPRRRELLAMLGVPFTVRVSNTEEVVTSINPAKVTEELSFQKAEAVTKELLEERDLLSAERMREEKREALNNFIIIGSDTVVSVDDQILGKPKNREEARKMIALLQGRAHVVYTGVTILCVKAGKKECRTFAEGTTVHVAPMSDEEIEAYINSDEPYDKAGGYGIQGGFARFIEGIEGDYFNVVGLPVHRVYETLKEFLCDSQIKTRFNGERF